MSIINYRGIKMKLKQSLSSRKYFGPCKFTVSKVSTFCCLVAGFAVSFSAAAAADIVVRNPGDVMDRSHLTRPRHQAAIGDSQPGSGQMRPGTMVVNYSPLDNILLVLRRGQPVKLVFPPWEEIAHVKLPPENEYRVSQDPADPSILYIEADIMALEEGSLFVTGGVPTGRSVSKYNTYSFLLRPVDINYPEDPDTTVIIRDADPSGRKTITMNRAPQDASVQPQESPEKSNRAPMTDSRHSARVRIAPAPQMQASGQQQATDLGEPADRPINTSSDAADGQARTNGSGQSMTIRDLLNKLAMENPEALRQALLQAQVSDQAAAQNEGPARKVSKLPAELDKQEPTRSRESGILSEETKREAIEALENDQRLSLRPNEVDSAEREGNAYMQNSAEPKSRPLADSFMASGDGPATTEQDGDVFDLLEAESNTYYAHRDETFQVLAERWAEKGGLKKPIFLENMVGKIIGANQEFEGPALEAFFELMPALANGPDKIGMAYDSHGQICFYPINPASSPLAPKEYENRCSAISATMQKGAAR